MNRPGGQLTPLMAGWTVFIVLTIAVASIQVSGAVLARENPRTREAAAVATPTAPPESAADPLDGIPLDGGEPANDPLDGDPFRDEPLDGNPDEDDPLDGPVDLEDPDVPRRQELFEIERSGRPEGAPRSVVAYDEDPETVWSPESDADETWLWLDLGQELRIRQVRWLARGAGSIDVSVSTDRERWTSVEEIEVEAAWQGVTLREDARYVRLELLPDDEGDLPQIAEVTVYGRDRGGNAVLAQDAEGDERANRRNGNRRERRERRAARAEQRAEQEENRETRRERRRQRQRNSDRNNGRTNVSAQEGQATCEGDGERCRARGGEVRMQEDCGSGDTCTIDVNVDGGTALCDATGGSRARAGDGEGRRGGEGGRCEAVADGGTVEIGDINP